MEQVCKRYLLLVICCIAATLFALANSFTATVTAYNAATLSGDVCDGMLVSYLQQQTNHHKSRLQAGESAQMNITGLPAGNILGVEISVRSNTASGAGEMQLSVNGSPAWTIPEASFASGEWYGEFSTTYVTLSHAFIPQIDCGDISLAIRSTENSLYFGSLTVYYAPPSMSCIPATVTFNTQTTAQVEPLTEDAPGSGIVLPSLAFSDSLWTFLGWTEQPVSAIDSLPYYFQAGTVYYPSTSLDLYALYTNRPRALRTSPQTTTVADGEYALVSPRYGVLLSSAVGSDGLINTLPCSLVQGDDSLYSLLASSLAPSCRFALRFSGDDLFITHVKSGQPIGHRKRGGTCQLANDSSAWQLLIADRGNLFICHDYDSLTSIGQAMRAEPGTTAATSSVISVSDRQTLFRSTGHYLVAVPVDDLPTEDPAVLYSAWPTADALPAIFLPSASQKRLRNGHVVILSADHVWSTSGRLIE